MKSKTQKIKKIDIQCTEPSHSVAVYYGFNIRKNPSITKADEQYSKQFQKLEELEKTFLPSTAEKAALMREYEEQKLFTLPQPLLIYHEKPSRKSDKYTEIHLNIIGTPKGIAEAILVKTAVTMLEEAQIDNIKLRLNSIGDKDSTNRFLKELNNFYRRMISDLSAEDRQLMKTDPALLLSRSGSAINAINDLAPQSISFLSDSSREQYKEVVEFIETLEIPWSMDNSLIGRRGYSSFTVFEITGGDKDEVFAYGSRFNHLSKKLGHKKEVPSVGITIFMPKLKKIKKVPLKASKCFFVQIGFDAKLRSLEVVELLRKSHIPLYQSLSRDKLSAQLSLAESMKCPYVMIMGQKEAIEGTVLVRNFETRAQTAVPIKELPKYLRTLK